MALAPEKVPYLFTVAEYLTFERASDERHEYLDGVIYAMASESPNHGRICTNLTRLLSTQLLGSPCEVFSKDTKVRSGPDQVYSRAGLWSYPDLVIVCGPGQYHDQVQDVLLNPRMLLEVLSPTTAAFDRGPKWDRYRTWLPSLQDYVLVAQDRPLIEHWHRLEDDAWRFETVQGLDATLQLPSLACRVPLIEVYDRIAFPQSEAALEPPRRP